MLPFVILLPSVTFYKPVLPFVTLCYPLLPCDPLCSNVLPCFTLFYPVLPCVTLCYSLLLFVTLCYLCYPILYETSSAAEWLQEALQKSCKRAGCSSSKFWLFRAAVESPLTAINSAFAAVQKIPESRSALQSGCKVASKRQRMLLPVMAYHSLVQKKLLQLLLQLVRSIWSRQLRCKTAAESFKGCSALLHSAATWIKQLFGF